jgi:hypothetical protein
LRAMHENWQNWNATLKRYLNLDTDKVIRIIQATASLRVDCV